MDSLLTCLSQSEREQDWARLLTEQGAFLRAVCRRHVEDPAQVDDAVQETLVVLQAQLRHYCPGNEDRARAWVATIARNTARHLQRSETARFRRQWQAYDAQMQENEPADAVDEELLVRLRNAVLSLPPRQRQAIELRFFNDLPVAEVATHLMTSPDTVRRTINHGILALRKQLKGSVRLSVGMVVAALGILSGRPVQGGSAAAFSAVSGGGLKCLLPMLMGSMVVVGLSLAAVCQGQATPEVPVVTNPSVAASEVSVTPHTMVEPVIAGAEQAEQPRLRSLAGHSQSRNLEGQQRREASSGSRVEGVTAQDRVGELVREQQDRSRTMLKVDSERNSRLALSCVSKRPGVKVILTFDPDPSRSWRKGGCRQSLPQNEGEIGPDQCVPWSHWSR